DHCATAALGAVGDGHEFGPPSEARAAEFGVVSSSARTYICITASSLARATTTSRVDWLYEGGPPSLAFGVQIRRGGLWREYSRQGRRDDAARTTRRTTRAGRVGAPN